tara:strand:+ start:447 stop:1277 length:831 start_codon:yes stop_codon:yes gene_type:complete
MKNENTQKKDNTILEVSKIKNFQDQVSSNKDLKENLKLGLKQTYTTTREVLPRVAISVEKYINEVQAILKDDTKTDEMMKVISHKGITTHCYDLVEYDRKKEKNDLFEKLVSRAIRLAVMKVNFPNEFSIDEKTNEVFVMSKVLEPKIPIKIKGSKTTKLVPNTDENLLPITTYTIDNLYKSKYPTATRNTKTKDSKIEQMIKPNAQATLKGLKTLIAKASKKDVKFFDLVDEETFEVFAELSTLLNSQDFQSVRSFSVEYRPDFNGKLEKISLAK